MKLDCTSNIDDKSTIIKDNWECDTDVMSTFEIKLVDDTYGGSINQTQADTIMSSGTSTFSEAGGNIYDIAEDSDISHGGLIINVVGPDDMYGNREMLLILKQGTSYRYWSLTGLETN